MPDLTGCELRLIYPGGDVGFHAICLAHDGDWVKVGDGWGARWVNLAHVAQVVVDGETADRHVRRIAESLRTG